MPTVGSLGEDDFVAGVIASVGAQDPPAWLAVGPGDDAAVADLAGLLAALAQPEIDVDGPARSGPLRAGLAMAGSAGSLVASTDTLVEDQDFKQHWSSAADVGVKVAAQNFADIAAMGARPMMLLVSLALPASADVAWASGLSAGLAQECARAGAVVAGGDVSQAGQIVITGTALGMLPPGQHAVLRSGARPGDIVAVAGELGRSAAGWALLEHGHHTTDDTTDAKTDVELDDLVQAHRRPAPLYEAGPLAAASGATALIDVSDGLIRDAGRIATASGVTIALDGGMLHPGPDLVRAGELVGRAPLGWVLTGGEDHALLACFDPAALDDGQLPAGFVAIGRAGHPAEAGAVLVDGRPWLGEPGWRHFTG